MLLSKEFGWNRALFYIFNAIEGATGKENNYPLPFSLKTNFS
jgi:hypothetical protein